MKKIFTLIAAACLCLCAGAKTRNAVWGTPANQGAWDAETNTYSWTASNSNLTTIFDCNADKLNNYTSLHLTTSDLVDGPYRVCFMNGGTAVATITFYSAGQKGLVFSERPETKDLDLSTITHISFGGASGAGSVKVTNVYLEGPDALQLIPQNMNEVSQLTGTNKYWANSVSYPFSFQSQDKSIGDGDGSSEATHVDISSYKKLYLSIMTGSDKGLALRVWIWDDVNSQVVTLYAHPDADFETADFTQAYDIKEPGIYSVDIENYKYLKGIKAANKWEGQTPVVVDYAWVSKDKAAHETALAVDGARTLSHNFPLDFTSVTDVEAYIATGVNGEKLQMKRVKGIVPANTGLVLKQASEKVAISIPVAGTATEDVSGNLLVATTAATEVPQGSYVLAGKGEDLGWYIVGKTVPTLAAGKCYLQAPSLASETHFVMDFDNEEGSVSGINEVSAVQTQEIYDITGRRVSAAQRGIFIIGGKKVIVK